MGPCLAAGLGLLYLLYVCDTVTPAGLEKSSLKWSPLQTIGRLNERDQFQPEDNHTGCLESFFYLFYVTDSV